VTFLFTDIEGSTKLLHELGPQAYADALAAHRRVVRDAVANHGGVEVDTQGDAFFLAFGSAEQAAEAAAEARDRLASSGRIRVRMGVHTGSPHLTDEGYVGVDVHRAARIGACAHGGQIVLSETAAAAVATAELQPLGEHRLKDFDHPTPLFQLGPGVFPPLRTLSNTNLPRPAGSFVGRDAEVADVVATVRDGARLVTLTGPGGTGKTRLAIAAATELVPFFVAGVFWVPLAPVRDADLVLPTIARTLGAQESVAAHIGDRHMLLLLDNVEQLMPAAADVRELVETCPHLVVLVTSRERFRVAGETQIGVATLDREAAVELFCTRAGVQEDASVRRLCEALDDLPLAIELAAARVAVLSPRQLLDRLPRRLDLLKGGRDADHRQQTLRRTIEWSYELLTDAERTLFARLSLFRGGCTLEAAESVLDADLDDLQSLVDKSLVRSNAGRFWMLETIAQYAAERFDDQPDRAALQRRHAEHFLAVVEEAEPHLRRQAKEWLDPLEVELDNVRAALDHLSAAGETQLLLRAVGAVWWLWSWRGYLAEGRARLLAALAADARPTEARGAALLGAADICFDLGSAAEGLRYAEEAARLCPPTEWRGVYVGFIQAMLRLDEGDSADAEVRLREAVAGFERVGDRHMAREARRRLAWLHEMAGDVELSTKLHEENLADAVADGDRGVEATTTSVLSGRAIDAGRYDDAVALASSALRLHLELGAQYDAIVDLNRFARVLAATGRLEGALSLVSATEELLRTSGRPLSEWLERHLVGVRERATRELEPAVADAAVLRGAQLDLQAAAQFALDSCAGAAVPFDPRTGPPGPSIRA
jgi:predicted ATPase